MNRALSNRSNSMFQQLKRTQLKRCLGAALVLLMSACAQQVTSSAPAGEPGAATKSAEEPYHAYLFTYFTGNQKSQEAIHFALSTDGYHYRALNGNKPVIASETISSTGGVRDPHILRGADGKTFYMVVTDMVSANGWSSNRAMVLLKSTDLINWTSSVVNIQQQFPGNEDLLRVWAPQTIYDPEAGKYMIYFSMKHGDVPDKIYYAYANKDFTALESAPRQLFFSPTNGASIDGDIIFKDGIYHLFFKTEGEGSGIKIATSDKLTEGYVLQDKYVQQTRDPVEGSGVFKLNDSEDYILMYDIYTKGKYQFTRSKDLQNFTIIDQEVSMNFHPRHGTVLPITEAEAARLMSKWGVADDVIVSAEAAEVKKINIALDSATHKLQLPLKPGTALQAFDPQFSQFPGVSITPQGLQNFASGPVRYTVAIRGQQPRVYEVTAAVARNPVLEGYYADPDVFYSEKPADFTFTPPAMALTTGLAPILKPFLQKIW